MCTMTSKKHTLESLNKNSQPSSKKSRKASAIPPITWAADDSILIWRLLNELEKIENYKVLFRKKTQHEVNSASDKFGLDDSLNLFRQNTSGECKTTVYRRVGKALFPDLYNQEPTTVGDRMKSKVERCDIYYLCHDLFLLANENV